MREHWTKVPDSIVRDPGLGCAEKLVWIFIAGMNERYTYTIKDACEMLGFANRTWLSAVKKLEGKGLITVERVQGKGNRYSVVENLHKGCVKNTQDVCKNYTPSSVKITQGQCKNYTTPVDYSVDQGSREKENKENIIKENKEKNSQAYDLESLLQLHWAEIMKKNLGIDDTGLLRALRDSEAYCVTNGIELTEANLKKYAYTSIKMRRQDYMTKSQFENYGRNGERWYVWGCWEITIPPDAPPRPSGMHQWDRERCVWYKE